MTHRKLDPKDEQVIGRLISSSGRRPEPPVGARDRVYAAVHAEWRRNVVEVAPAGRSGSMPDWLSLWLRPGLAVAAAAVIAVGVAIFLRAPTGGEPAALAEIGKVVGVAQVVDDRGGITERSASSGMTIFVGQRLVTGPESGIAVELASGESVRLNAGSELAFASAGSIELRSGDVYLDSEAASGPGTVVTTPYGDVRHIGTQYEVSLQPGDLRVRVREGIVAIAADAVDFVGRAGEQIIVPRSGDVERTDIAATDPAWTWTESLAALPDASEYPLTELLAWVARQTGRDVRFANQAARSAAEGLVLHGIGGLTPQETYDVIRSTTGLDYRMTGANLVID